MSYLGNSPGQSSQRIIDTFNVGSTTATFTPSSGYTLGYLDVYLNGVKLVNGDDYTATNGTTFTLTSSAVSGDVVEAVAYIPRGLSDGYTKAEADAKYLTTANAVPATVSDKANTSTGYFDLPSGTTAQRPASPNSGMARFNTDTNKAEYYNGTTWIDFNNAGITPTVEYLVVAGGGGGGDGTAGGGGGGGGFRTATGFSVTAGSPITVTVGAGGASVYGATSSKGGNGGNSVFGSITSTGGGGGGAEGNANGASGGSGGGGAYAGAGGSGTSGQGNVGGNGTSGGNRWTGGGGGGAGAAGQYSSAYYGGAGGDGTSSSISGSAVTYAGGGGGAAQSSGGGTVYGGAGGAGGGGTGPADQTGGQVVNGGDGSANTGGGGGGNVDSASARSGAGGSGVVIIRYSDAYSSATATTGSPTVTVAGGYRVYKWTTSGSITF